MLKQAAVLWRVLQVMGLTSWINNSMPVCICSRAVPTSSDLGDVGRGREALREVGGAPEGIEDHRLETVQRGGDHLMMTRDASREVEIP